jgi:hypothetical protein
MQRMLFCIVLVACGGKSGSSSTTPEPPAADQTPFDQQNTKLREELGTLLQPSGVVAEYSGLKGKFHHRIRVPYKDISEVRALTLGETWQVEIRAISERDKDVIEPVYIRKLEQAAAERAVEILIELRDHHKQQ